jgi:hypothetical protein
VRELPGEDARRRSRRLYSIFPDPLIMLDASFKTIATSDVSDSQRRYFSIYGANWLKGR